jgi:putative MATE family efflux protein
MSYTENVIKDFFKIFLPLMAVFFFLLLTNIVDTWFASRLGVDALAAMQAIFPIFFFFLAINEAFTSATNNLLSISLWEKDYEKLNKYFTFSVLFALILWIFFFFIWSYIIKFFLWLMNLTPNVYKLAYDYISVFVKFSWFYFLAGIIWAVLIVFHKKKFLFFLAILNLFNNIILNWLFLYKFWLWVSGIAYATVLMWFLSIILFLIKYILLDKLVKFDFDIKYFIEHNLIKKYFSYRISAFLSLQIFVAEFLISNYFVSLVWDKALAAYWVWSRVAEVLFNPIWAWWVAFVTILWYWYGSRNKNMLWKVISEIFRLFLIYVIIACILSFTFLVWLSKFFTNDIEVLKLTKMYLYILGIFFIFFGINFFYSQVFQVTWFHKFRIWLNILLVLLIGLFEYIFYNYLDNSFLSIWLWWLFAQILASLITFSIYKLYVSKKLLNV